MTHPQGFRAFRSADEQAALALINADRITGQPTCTAAILAEALAGRSAIDSGWWAELESLTTEVLVTELNEVVGVVSYAWRSRDGTGLVLWLHGREVAEVVDALVLRALTALQERPVHAFDFATALGLGLEALPVRHRPVTHAALLGAGFTPRPLWRYMWRPLPAEEPPRALPVQEEERGHTLRLIVRGVGGKIIAEAKIGLPDRGVGVLWWIEVRPSHRGGGLGQSLLGEALTALDSQRCH